MLAVPERQIRYIGTVITSGLELHIAHLLLRGLATNTIIQRRYALARLATFLCADPANASANDLTRWQTMLLHRSPAYRASLLSHVRSFYQWQVDEGIRPDDPSAKIPMPKLRVGLPRPITEEHLEYALMAAPDRIRTWFVLAGYGGLRACEIATLQRQDILDTAEVPIMVINGKGGRQRIVPLNETLLTALRIYGLPQRGIVFLRADGAPGGNTAVRVSQMANAWLHQNGIPETLHQLRHRFASKTLDGCGNVRTVQGLLGHQSLATTAIYMKLNAEDGMKAVRSLDRPILRSA